MSKRTKMQEAEERADADQAAANRESLEQADAAFDNGERTAADSLGEAAPRVKRPREVSYQLWGLARSNVEWEYIQDLATIGQVRRWVVGSQNLARKTYSCLKVIRQKKVAEFNLDFCRPDDVTVKGLVK